MGMALLYIVETNARMLINTGFLGRCGRSHQGSLKVWNQEAKDRMRTFRQQNSRKATYVSSTIAMYYTAKVVDRVVWKDT